MAKLLNQSQLHNAIGTHIIADLYQCKALTDNQFVKSVLQKSAEVSFGTVLHSKFHEFTPQGLTGYILLAESHISIHTWPETGYAAVDVFTCGTKMRPEAAIEYIVTALQAGKKKIRIIKRDGDQG